MEIENSYLNFFYFWASFENSTYGGLEQKFVEYWVVVLFVG